MDLSRKAAFLAEIIVHPDDDAPRLIYADYLDEHGESEHAAFIRVQIELAHAIPEEMPERIAELRRRELELLAEDGRLCGAFHCYFSTPEGQGFWLDDDCFHAVWHRGFIESVNCTCAAWLAHGPGVVRAAPVKTVRLLDRKPIPIPAGLPLLTGGYDWVVPFADVPSSIPECIARHLTIFSDFWLTHEAAHAALSSAALAWARTAARLLDVSLPSAFLLD